jgi:NADPH:quinone reductase-like Zn-dependent oxidoreductase
MKAVVCRTYGSPDVLQLGDIERPAVGDDGVLVRVHAASVNPADFYPLTPVAHMVRLVTGRLHPKPEVMGIDFAGTVESVGNGVTEFRPGDAVFGGVGTAFGRRGAFAEYVCVPEHGAVVRKPGNVTFEQAAAVPVAATTALQALRDHGRIQPRQRVLINGASGGVGTFAVQLAKAFGADVTGVCSPRNVDTARSLGADRVIDYTQEDFTRSGQRYDLLLDIAGNRSWSACTRVLGPTATVVNVGAAAVQRDRGAGGVLSHTARVLLASAGGSRRVVVFIAKLTKADLVVLQELLEAGSVRPVVDRCYALSEVPAALRYLQAGHAKGKVVIAVRAADHRSDRSGECQVRTGGPVA